MTAEPPVSFLEVMPPPGWDCLALGDLIDQDRGISYGIVQPGKNEPAGVPIVRVNNIRNGRIETSDVLRVSDDIEQKYQRTRLRGGEILLSLVGTLGECAVVPKELSGWNVARAVAVIPLLADVDARWVVTCLRSRQLQNLMKNWATTTVQATLNLRDVRRLPIVVPPPDEVEAMMQLVSPLDDKIELNRQMNRTLEAMARAIFKAWFVDFEPVKAKADGATSFRGMPQEIFDQLPDRFVESELGPVPKEWRIETVGSLCDFNYGKALKASNRRSGCISVYGSNGLVGYHDQALVDGPGIVVGRKGKPGTVIWVHTEFFPIDTTFFVSKSQDAPVNLSYLRYALEDLQLGTYGSDSAVPGLNRNMAYSLPVVVPDGATGTAFEELFLLHQRMIYENERESATLATIRDTLLPNLISGKLRVEYAGKNLESAL